MIGQSSLGFVSLQKKKGYAEAQPFYGLSFYTIVVLYVSSYP